MVYGNRQKSLVDAVDDHETSILHFTKSDELRTVHNWLLQTNFRIDNMDKQIKYYLKMNAYSYLNKDQQIKTLNLLHLQDNIPYAIFTLQSMKKQEESDYYLKYLEFLECQHQDIIEDSFDCFIAYNQYFEDQMYLDEWIDHLIRIGIKVLLAQEGIKQIIIPQKFKDFISSKLEFDQPLFKLSKTDILIEYIEQLQYYIETCNSEHYEYQSNLLLIVLILNIQNLTYELKEKLLQNFQNDSTYSFYKNTSVPQSKESTFDVLFIKGYFEEKLVTLQIKQKSNTQTLKLLTRIVQISGKVTFKKLKNQKQWNQFIKEMEIIQIQTKIKQQIQNKSTPQVIRFYQFNQLQLKDILQQFNGIQHESLIINIYNFQEELLKLRQNTLRGADLQFINQILNNSTSILREIKNGNLKCKDFEELKLQYQSWRDHINIFEKNEQELLERNRQILKLKWQKLQAGVKVQKKFDSNVIQTVEEHSDEDSQD